MKKRKVTRKETLHGAIKDLKITAESNYKKIAVTVDFSDMDSKAISTAIAQGGKNAEYLLIHIVETAGAIFYMNSEVLDLETKADRSALDHYADELKKLGYQAQTQLGYGNPKKSIPDIVNQSKADLLIMAAHGHKAIKDIVLGTTLDTVRHHVNIPVLIVTA